MSSSYNQDHIRLDCTMEVNTMNIDQVKVVTGRKTDKDDTKLTKYIVIKSERVF